MTKLKKMLLEVDSTGLMSLWDDCPVRRERFPHWAVVVPVRFKDGSHGLLPEAQATALSELLDYNWENEEIDYAQVGEGEENHIVHAYRKLAYEGGPEVKPYLDSE